MLVARAIADVILLAGVACLAWELVRQLLWSRGGEGSLSHVLCGVSFGFNFLSLALQLMHSTLTRRFAVKRLMLGLLLCTWTAALLMRDHLSDKAIAETVAGVPLLLWYCFWAREAMAPPKAGEALRPATDLRSCHWITKLGILAVLVCEFLQFNSLPFNPELDVWSDVDVGAIFSFSFFLFDANNASALGHPTTATGAGHAHAYEPSSHWTGWVEEGRAWLETADARKQVFWLCIVLGVGWALFASVVTRIPTMRRQPSSSSSSSLRGGGLGGGGGGDDGDDEENRHHSPSHVARASEALALSAADELDPNYTTEIPVWLAVLFIHSSAREAARRHRAWLRRCRLGAWHAAWAARGAKPAACAPPLLLLLLLLAAGPVVFVLALLTAALATCVAASAFFGLCVCGAFSIISLLHFPIMMQVLPPLPSGASAPPCGCVYPFPPSRSRRRCCRCCAATTTRPPAAPARCTASRRSAATRATT